MGICTFGYPSLQQFYVTLFCNSGYEDFQVHTYGKCCNLAMQQLFFTGEMEPGKVHHARQGKQSADKAAGDSS